MDDDRALADGGLFQKDGGPGVGEGPASGGAPVSEVVPSIATAGAAPGPRTLSGGLGEGDFEVGPGSGKGEYSGSREEARGAGAGTDSIEGGSRGDDGACRGGEDRGSASSVLRELGCSGEEEVWCGLNPAQWDHFTGRYVG